MQPVGGGWQRRVLGCLGTFADLSLGLLVVKAMTGVLLGPSCTQPGPAQEATSKSPGQIDPRVNFSKPLKMSEKISSSNYSKQLKRRADSQAHFLKPALS